MAKVLNKQVNAFLDELKHPLREEIETLRSIILNANKQLNENIKWNAPNYYLENADIITMKIYPPRKVQLIFHRGAKVKEQPANRLMKKDYEFLFWKANDRAVATFESYTDIQQVKPALIKLIKEWCMEAVEGS
jgi:hypothetical protein